MILSILLCRQINWYVQLFTVIITKVQAFSRKLVHLNSQINTFCVVFYNLPGLLLLQVTDQQLYFKYIFIIF